MPVFAFAPRASNMAGPTLKRLILCGACVAVLLLAWACTPSYDWRLVHNPDGAYSVMLPAKPLVDERTLDIAGTPMKVQMQTAEVGDAMFAIGVATLPANDPRLQVQVLAYLQSGLARNLGAKPVLRPVPVRVDGASSGSITGMAMDVSGAAAGEQGSNRRVIHARFAARGRHVYQAVVISQREPAQEQIDQFFSSWQLD
jgi:hypothetical protein